VKFYQYVSDSKVDMLYAQIPDKLSRRISAQLDIDLKLVSLTLTPEVSPETRYSKCRVVAEYLREHAEVGSTTAPRGYFQGTENLFMRVLDTTVVWLGRRGSTFVALTGSQDHLIMAAPTPDRLWWGSAPGQALPELAQSVEQSLADPRETAQRAAPSRTGMDPLEAVTVLAANTRPDERPQSLEFLAKRHEVRAAEWSLLPPFTSAEKARLRKPDIEQVVLASPIYVAHTT
jgi:Family of unknown function (DUF7019)